MAGRSSDVAPLYIPGRRVKELVSMGDVLKAVETGLGAYSRPDGGVVQPDLLYLSRSDLVYLQSQSTRGG